MHGGELRLPAAAGDRHHPVTLDEPLRAGAAGDDLAGELEPGDVLRRAGRSRVAAAELMHVRAVQPGSPDADQDLASAGLRVWMLLDEDLAVADGGGAHGAAVYDAAPRGRPVPSA